jgi:hypothetical protein
MGDVTIRVKDVEMVRVEAVVENPKNRNRHSIEQIDRLAKIVEFNGFRDPLIVSRRSGFLICGHGRLSVARKLGMKEVPVLYQDFASEAEEYQFMTAHNEIARWSELDVHGLLTDMKDLDLGDISLLGIENQDALFKPIDIDMGEDEPAKEKSKSCPECGAVLA